MFGFDLKLKSISTVFVIQISRKNFETKSWEYMRYR